MRTLLLIAILFTIGCTRKVEVEVKGLGEMQKVNVDKFMSDKQKEIEAKEEELRKMELK